MPEDEEWEVDDTLEVLRDCTCPSNCRCFNGSECRCFYIPGDIPGGVPDCCRNYSESQC